MKDETDAIYDIEVQTTSHVSFVPRILGRDSQMERGDETASCSERYHSGLSALSAVERPAYGSGAGESGRRTIHFLRLGDMRQNPAELDKLNTELRNWMTFLGYGFEYERDKMNTMLMESPLAEEYKKFSATPELRRLAAERQRFLIDYSEGNGVQRRRKSRRQSGNSPEYENGRYVRRSNFQDDRLVHLGNRKTVTAPNSNTCSREHLFYTLNPKRILALRATYQYGMIPFSYMETNTWCLRI